MVVKRGWIKSRFQLLMLFSHPYCCVRQLLPFSWVIKDFLNHLVQLEGVIFWRLFLLLNSSSLLLISFRILLRWLFFIIHFLKQDCLVTFRPRLLMGVESIKMMCHDAILRIIDHLAWFLRCTVSHIWLKMRI